MSGTWKRVLWLFLRETATLFTFIALFIGQKQTSFVSSLNFIRLLRVVITQLPFTDGVITTRSNRMKFRLAL